MGQHTTLSHVSTQHQPAHPYAYHPYARHPEQHEDANTRLHGAQRQRRPQRGAAQYGAQRYASQRGLQHAAVEQHQRLARPNGPRRQRPHPVSDAEHEPEHEPREYYGDLFARAYEGDLVARHHHKVNWGKVEGAANTVSNVVGTGVKIIGTVLDHLRREDVEELYARGELDDELVARDIDEELFSRALQEELVARKVNLKKVGHVFGDIAKTALHFIPFFKREDELYARDLDLDELVAREAYFADELD